MHPYAAAQPSAYGRAISSLTLLDGRIYAGYGDYNANTGPIHVSSLAATDPLGDWTDHITLDTEQINAFRLLEDGRILVPEIDSHSDVGGGYGVRSALGVWSDEPTAIKVGGETEPKPEHVMDICEFAGDLWACGSDDDPDWATGYATVWRSTDGGATWTRSLHPNLGGSPLFSLVLAAGQLRVQDYYETPTAYLWNGTTWAPDSAVITGLGPGEAWGTKYVSPDGLAAQGVWVFDGAASVNVSDGVFSVGDDGNLYVMSTAGMISRIAPDLSREDIGLYAGPIAMDFTSLCVLPGSAQALIGTSLSTVLLADL